MTPIELERLSRLAYDAHRNASPDSHPAWEDAGDAEHRAWLAAVSAVTNQGDVTLSEMPPVHSLIVQCEDQTHVFQNDFTAGRQGALKLSDDHASGNHAVFQYAHGLWYVEDLGSTNGTWLNSRRIFSAQRLKKGDKVKIGHTVVLIVST
jgi:pSer/pThr/pTyr-binding forkhead associated (FHA) protein